MFGKLPVAELARPGEQEPGGLDLDGFDPQRVVEHPGPDFDRPDPYGTGWHDGHAGIAQLSHRRHPPRGVVKRAGDLVAEVERDASHRRGQQHHQPQDGFPPHRGSQSSKPRARAWRTSGACVNNRSRGWLPPSQSVQPGAERHVAASVGRRDACSGPQRAAPPGACAIVESGLAAPDWSVGWRGKSGVARRHLFLRSGRRRPDPPHERREQQDGARRDQQQPEVVGIGQDLRL